MTKNYKNKNTVKKNKITKADTELFSDNLKKKIQKPHTNFLSKKEKLKTQLNKRKIFY